MKGKQRKYGADESGKTFGPGHDGWYDVTPRDLTKRVTYARQKANSAFAACAAAGTSLTESTATPITCPECIYELEHGEVGPYSSHTCEENYE